MRHFAAMTILSLGLALLASGASANIGLTRQEAFKDAEQVVRGYFPKGWKENEENLHCIGQGGKRISCPPLVFYKKLSAEEIQILYSLVVDLQPYRSIEGSVFITASPSSKRGFYFRAERCKFTRCYELGA